LYRAHEIHVTKAAPTEPEKRAPVREPFLTATPEYTTSKKLQQLLEKYLQRKQRQQQRQQQVSERVFLLLVVSSILVK